MFEASLIALLAADAQLVALLDSFEGAPAIFTDVAPQKATRPYIVFDIDKLSVENLAASGFTIDLHTFIRKESGKVMREIATRLTYVCDRIIIDNDTRFGQIRLFWESGREVENSDIKIRHYVTTLSARAGRKEWAAQIT